MATLCHERPCFVVCFRQEACDVPVGAAELEALNDFRLNLWARVGLRKLSSQIHTVHAALGRDQREQMLTRRFRKRRDLRTEVSPEDRWSEARRGAQRRQLNL